MTAKLSGLFVHNLEHTEKEKKTAHILGITELFYYDGLADRLTESVTSWSSTY
jgi:hypothetical protein